LLSVLLRSAVGGLPIGLAVAVLLLSVPSHPAAAKTPRAKPIWRQAAIPVDPDDGLSALHYVTAPAVEAVNRVTEPRPIMVSNSLRVARGDTLMDMLVDAGVARREAHGAIVALRELYDPRKLKPGQEIRVALSGGENAGRLLALGLQPDVEHDLRVTRMPDDAFVAEILDRELLRVAITAEGKIDNNLSAAATDAGLPMPVLVEMIRVFSFDVDFQRELQPGDSFEVLYEALFEDDGSLAKTDGVLYASLTLSGERLDMYNFTPRSGHDDFFDRKGRSVRKTLMRTPIDGARLSSRFGMRKHPILGYSRLHKGTDFAAPRGTPIYAAGKGVIESAGRNGGYGKYIRIRHNSTYKTAYAHMSRIAKGMRRGKRVRQGQIIGYVGSTGRSTGPHLHYEVLRGGRQVNPLKIKLPSGEKLKAVDLEDFQTRREHIDALRQRVRDGDAVIAQAGCRPTSGDAVPAC
jgi:murein DD-endopeptidase MepM/ murein hydrolase activator NlpD